MLASQLNLLLLLLFTSNVLDKEHTKEKGQEGDASEQDEVVLMAHNLQGKGDNSSPQDTTQAKEGVKHAEVVSLLTLLVVDMACLMNVPPDAHPQESTSDSSQSCAEPSQQILCYFIVAEDEEACGIFQSPKERSGYYQPLLRNLDERDELTGDHEGSIVADEDEWCQFGFLFLF